MRCICTRERQMQDRTQTVYDEKVQGIPFNCGDLVWLHSPTVPTPA